MRAFVTGGTGFVGGPTVRRLIAGGHKAVCLVRRPAAATDLERAGATLHPGDVTDRESLRAGMAGCDWVIHLANVFSFWEPDPTVYTRVNVEGTRNVLECALEAGVGKVVHVSTTLTYGKSAEVPFTETSPQGPERFSAYAESKYQGDRIAWQLRRERSLPLVVIYPGVVLGPSNPKTGGEYISNFVNRRLPATVFLNSVLGYVHVDDVAEAIVLAAEHLNNLGEEYILAHESITFRDYNRLLTEVSGVPAPRITLPDGMGLAMAVTLTAIADRTKRPPLWGMATEAVRTVQHGFYADGSKVERDLGLRYTPIRQAVEEEVAWLRAKAGKA